MALFRPVSPKKISPAEFRAFQHGLFCGRCFFLVDHPILGRKNPLVLIRAALFSLCGFLPGFPFEFMYFIVQKSVVFIDIPPDCIQHKFLVYLFCRTVMKPAKFIVFFYVPKVVFLSVSSGSGGSGSLFRSECWNGILPSVPPSAH